MKFFSTLVIPFFKNEEYIENIGQFFSQNPKERQLFVEVLIINDCPDSNQSSYLESASARYGFSYVENPKNIGFLLSANRGIKKSIENGGHVVVLNSDTIPTPGCFSELLSVFEFDSMVGCVCPRSNNATIANLWPAPIFVSNKTDVDKLAEMVKFISDRMPKVSYTPVINGFCFAIRNSVVINFGGFDEDFVPGYEEENEYCLRISESGYKVAIANHSFIGHLEGRSFSLKPGRAELMEDHYNKIIAKYPYYSEIVNNYFSSPEKKALDLLSIGGKPNDNITVLVDGRVLHCHHNGTMKVIRDVVVALSEIGYNVDLIADTTAAKFHKIDKLAGVSLIESPQKLYDIGIKIGQPFERHSLLTVPLFSKCPINIFFDTIAVDCINSFDKSINEYWSLLDDLYSLTFFISDHSRHQFINRYNPLKTECISLLLPINLESKKKNLPSIIDSKYIFVIGNKFKHKGIDIALNQLPVKDGIKYVLLSEKMKSTREDLIYLQPGLLTDDEINSLYENAEKIIFPSFSEGFGFPLIEALHYRKKIVCRPLDSLIEIYSTLPLEYKKLITFSENFSQENELIYSDLSINDDYCRTEKEYIQRILKTGHVKSKEIKFNEIKKRISFAEFYLSKYSNSSHKIYSSKNSIARKIYLRLMYFKFTQPYLLWLKKQIKG